jgi:hypothetical protein
MYMCGATAGGGGTIESGSFNTAGGVFSSATAAPTYLRSQSASQPINIGDNQAQPVNINAGGGHVTLGNSVAASGDVVCFTSANAIGYATVSAGLVGSCTAF